jgi:CBS domain-containing protein
MLATRLREGQNDMTIQAILLSKGVTVHSVKPDDSLTEAVAVLRKHRIGAALVIEGGSMISGVLSERDIVRAIGDHGASALDLPVHSVMTAPVITCRPEDTVASAMSLMTTRRIRHLPVIDEGKLIGMVSIGDLVKRRIEESEREAAALKDYISHG